MQNKQPIYNKLPSLIDEASAKNLAKHLFKRYDVNKSGFLEEKEIELMIRDVPRILNKPPALHGNYDVAGLRDVLDVNQDGKVCFNDVENYVLRFFV